MKKEEKLTLCTIQECSNPECGFMGRAEIQGVLSGDLLTWRCQECGTEQPDNNPLGRSVGETLRASEALGRFWEWWQEDEGNKSYRRFTEASATAGGKGFILATILKWSRLNHWKVRIARQNEMVTARKIEAVSMQRRAAALELAKRCELQQKLELEDAELMRERGRVVLDSWPYTKTVVRSDELGEKTKVVMPAGSSEFRAAAALLETASKLERGALGIPVTSRSEVTIKDWRTELESAGVDPAAVLERLVEQITNSMRAVENE